MAESAAYSRRGHSGAATATTLASGITAGATSIDLTDASTWTGADDNGPFRATISDGTTEEEIEVTAVSGNTLTGVTRGVGGTTAAAWDAGDSIEHTSSVRDYDEANYWVAELAAAIGAANTFFYGDGDNSIAGTAVAASRFLGRKASGDLGAMTVAEAVTLLQSTELAEYIADTVGTMVTGNTETGITVTYQDADNTLDFEVSSVLTTEGFRANRSTNQALGAATFTTIVFDTEVRDEGADYNNTTGEWTVPATGWYDVAAGIEFSSLADGNRYAAYIDVGGSIHTYIGDHSQGAGNTAFLSGGFPLYLTAGNVVTVKAFRTSAGNVSTASFFTAKRRY